MKKPKSEAPKRKQGGLTRLERIGIRKDRVQLLENLTLLVGSGMSVDAALKSIGQELRSKRMKQLTEWMREEIVSGAPLWRVLKRAKIFPDHTIALAKIGEASGKLSDNLDVIRGQEEKDQEFRSKIRSAMMYPAFVLSLTLIVGVGITWFILPNLTSVFSQLDIELPLATRILIAFGDFLAEYGSIAVPAFLATFFVSFYFIFFFSRTKHIGQAIVFYIPGVKDLLQEIEISRFGYLLGTLLEAGLPILQALRSVYAATTIARYRKFYAKLYKKIEDGYSFQRAFDVIPRSRRLFPSAVQQLIVVGERSGSLSESLLKVSERYEARTSVKAKNLSVILEPLLLVIVWLGVLAVAIGVILPIYSLIGGFDAS